MKAEERKSLETNALAQEIGKALDTIKQGPSRSTMAFLFVCVAVVGGGLLFRFLWRSSEAAASQRWLKLDEVVFPTQLTTILGSDDGDSTGKGSTKESAGDPEFQGTEQGRIAKFKLARVKLTEGIRDLGANLSLATKNIDEGTKLYEQLIDQVSRVPLLHQEALWGAAKGNESVGYLDKAKEFYQKLVKEYPTSAMGKDSAKQIDRLNSDAGKRDLNELLKAFTPPK